LAKMSPRIPPHSSTLTSQGSEEWIPKASMRARAYLSMYRSWCRPSAPPLPCAWCQCTGANVQVYQMTGVNGQVSMYGWHCAVVNVQVSLYRSWCRPSAPLPLCAWGQCIGGIVQVSMYRWQSTGPSAGP
jgi:hypothetical protein